MTRKQQTQPAPHHLDIFAARFMHTTRDIDIEVQIGKELTLGDYVFDDEAPAGVLEASGS